MEEVVRECGIVKVWSTDENRVSRSEASGPNAITGSLNGMLLHRGGKPKEKNVLYVPSFTCTLSPSSSERDSPPLERASHLHHLAHTTSIARSMGQREELRSLDD